MKPLKKQYPKNLGTCKTCGVELKSPNHREMCVPCKKKLKVGQFSRWGTVKERSRKTYGFEGI